jgi:hypothetical protein
MESETETEDNAEIVSTISANGRPLLEILPRKSFAWFLNEVQLNIVQFICCTMHSYFHILAFMQISSNNMSSPGVAYDQQFVILKRWNAMSEKEKLVCNQI